MGWYDAFKGDTARVNLQNNVTSNSGSAAKNFGDAFSQIGKSMYDAEMDKDKSAVLDLQKQNEQNKLDTTQEVKTQKNLDDAFSKSYQSFDSKAEWEKQKAPDTSKVSADALKKEKEYFKTIANDTGYANAITAGVGDKDGMSFEDWRTNNPNASAAVVAKVQKLIDGKDTTKAKIESATKDLKHENDIVKLNAKLAKSAAKNAKLSASKDSSSKTPKVLSPTDKLKYITSLTPFINDENGKPTPRKDIGVIKEINKRALEYEKNGMNFTDAVTKSQEDYANFLQEEQDKIPKERSVWEMITSPVTEDKIVKSEEDTGNTTQQPSAKYKQWM